MRQKIRALPRLLQFPVSVLAWALVAFFSVFFFLVGLIFGFFPSLVLFKGTRSIMHRVAEIWAETIIRISPVWGFTVTGNERFDPRKPYVIVANHQSFLDILALLAALHTHFKFIAKKELFWIPCFGWHMALAGYVALERGDRASAKAAMDQARHWIRRRVSMLFFPEGTRSEDGNIKAFKAGAFKLAQETGVEILPVVIDGTAEAIPKKTFLIKKASHFSLSIEKPFRVEADGACGIDEAITYCRGLMIRRLEEMRRETHL